MSMDEKCWVCGASIEKSFFPDMDIMSGRFCRKHWHEHTKQYRGAVAEYLKLKTVIMFERTMRTMERCCLNMTEYKREAMAVQKHSEEFPEQYRSSDEMVAAVILLHAGIDFEMNYKIGKFTVDFYIPSWKIIVEIDGDRHEHRLLFDSKRDSELRNALGQEWEIIRVPTKYIEQNPAKLPEAVQALAKQKRTIRKKNGGFLPQNYSKRESALYENAMIYDEIHVKA